MVISSMAQDVFSKMAEEPCLLKEDGYLNADTDLKQIVYHPTLNVILICTNSGVVRVLDVNSGVVLQSTNLSAQEQNEIKCQYICGQDRTLFCDGQTLGVRSDYNGVLLLDTILQKSVTSGREDVQLELLLSEAMILKQCLSIVNNPTVEYVINELNGKIQEAQKQCKKGIKAQKWNTVCIEVPLEVLSSAASSVMTELIVKNQHSPEIGVASAIQERASELLGEPFSASDRKAMASEAKRRETFAQWPHMDYKWALPDQMAQAGFYHQPNSAGDDRAMCFMCTVCLVCWERTDEPWSEHERHSPTCPFVMGEYTQNVPLSVTFATNPAVDATYRGVGVNTLGTSSVPHLFPTSNKDGLVAVYDVSGKIKRTHAFFVTQYDSHLLEKFTEDFSTLNSCHSDEVGKSGIEKEITALTLVGEKSSKVVSKCSKTNNNIRPSVICGIMIRDNESLSVNALNDQNRTELNIMEVDDSQDCSSNNSCLYLVVYDFQYTKDMDMENKEPSDITNDFLSKSSLFPPFDMDSFGGMSALKPLKEAADKYILSHEFTMYQNLIPGESDAIFIPPTIPSQKEHPGPRSIPIDYKKLADMESEQAAVISSDFELTSEKSEKSISDHISDIQNSKTKRKKLNYSRAVQCISIPDTYKNRQDLKISNIIPSQDGRFILVVLKSVCDMKNSALMLYSLDFSDRMVKVEPQGVMLRELASYENPVEVSLIPVLDKTLESQNKLGVDGLVIMVCEDGAVRVLDLANLKIIAVAKLDSEKFVSAVYCNSLERLCASTEKGSLHFYALNDTDSDSTEEHEEDDMMSANADSSGINPNTDTTDGWETNQCFHDPPDIIPLAELKRLHSLCNFEPFKGGFNPVVPPCWSEMQQAPRQRRHPQALQKDKEQLTKTWRLQTDTTTWDEHVFEIILPTPTNIGHVDVNFVMHNPTNTPNVEFTLLRQNSTSIGHKRDVKFSVDDIVTFDQLENTKNPVTSQEYLRAHNADILAGPIDITNCVDLTEKSGCVTLTSPKLFRSRNRNLLLHIKSVCKKEEIASVGSSTRAKRPSGSTTNAEYMGCDCIHELTITVYSSTHTDIPHERSLRCSMLESKSFVQSLLLTCINDPLQESQCVALDILNWVASIRIAGNRSCEEPNTQQAEFFECVEAKILDLLTSCALHSGRNIAYKCVKLLVLCSENSSNDNFDTSILNSLLELVPKIYEVKSAGAIHCISILIYKVAKNNELVRQLTARCVNLLTEVADQLNKRINPYHLILRSRYGLYGTPLEPELFDVDAPSPMKASNSTVTYASVVAGENVPPCSDFHTNFAFNKDILDAREVLLNVNETKSLKLKNITTSKLFRGLLETEHLHFVCIAASDGTRMERAEMGSNNIIPNVVPFTVTNVNSASKTVEVEQLLGDFDLMSAPDKTEKIINSAAGTSNGHSMNDSLLNNVLIYSENMANEGFAKIFKPKITSAADALGSEVVESMNEYPVKAPTRCAEEILSPNRSLPWQQLLVAPSQQVIVVERMHSGARRFVTLDFGQPILLTDLFIPMCLELLSISIDIGLKAADDSDMVCLITSTDISTKNIAMSNIQSPPLCRYMKITAVGIYGMSSTRCRIPIGSFYGHLIVLPDEISEENAAAITPPTHAELDKQLNVLSMLFEDVSCRYSLACSKLKNLLQPFLMSDTTNTAHLNAYMDIMKDKSNCSVFDNMKIFNAYQEAITYQRQLNTVRNVITRIETSLNKQTKSAWDTCMDEVSTDKLRCIAEVMLEALLVVDTIPKIPLPTCEKIFRGFCITQRSHLQFLAATVLDQSCRKKCFWGVFLADTLAEMFSSSYTSKFPQDRVFILLAYLAKRCSERSIALDSTLRVIAETLQPMNDHRKGLLGVSVDLSLLGWQLLFLSLQLDLSKGSLQNSTRWDWVTGEMGGGKGNDSVHSNYRRKLHKRFLMYKQHLDQLNMDYNQKVVQSSAQAFSALTNQAQTLTEKLEKALKGPNGIFSKLKTKIKKDQVKEPAPASKVGKRRRDNTTEAANEKNASQISEPQYVDSTHCLTVVRGLVSLLLAMDHSCSADLFVLSCKVIARLVKLSNLLVEEYLNEEKLLKLINLSIGSELPFATHALACFLQDVLEVGKTIPTKIEVDIPAPSTSWTPDILDNLVDTFDVDDTLMSDPMAKQGKTSTSNNHLPSVFESDDSEVEEFLDEVLERGRNILRKNAKTPLISTGCSSAIDQRLDVGVECQAEVIMRRLVLCNTHTLMQNVNSPANVVEVECKVPKWPENLTAPASNAVPRARSLSNTALMTGCFDMLFKDLDLYNASKIEQILQLWLTLNCPNSEENFNPATMPVIALSVEAINSLISTIAWCSDLSLRTWCSALQTLTMMCNICQGKFFENNDGEEEDITNMFGKVSVIINHSDFVQMLLRLLSGTGIQLSERGLAGPAVCKAMHDFLMRLQMRCDVTNSSSLMGTMFKSYMLKVVYQLVQPTGPFVSKLGPLDAQCKFLQCLVCLEYSSTDLSIAMSILESTAALVYSHVSNVERIKCVNIGEKLSGATNTFSIFASVLGGETNKQDKPVSWDVLLIYLLKLLGSLVQTPLPSTSTEQVEYMETDNQLNHSQTDESKAEQIHQDPSNGVRSSPPVPCLADTVLQHHPSIIRFCKALATCKATSLCMISYSYLNTQNVFSDLREPGSVGDSVFNVLVSLARKASRKELVMEPLLMFLSQSPQLSEPLIWFIIQVLDTAEALQTFVQTGGVKIICESLVKSSNAPNTISGIGNISMVMQHFIGQNAKTEASAIGVPSNTKKQQQASLENNLNLVNFAPQGTIRCSAASTAHSPEILIQGGQATHRRARAAQWAYHFYPEEAHADLTIQLPSAILLREVHIQPHQGTLATCPSAVSLEVSADGPWRLVPACPPLPTSGMAFIRLHLPTPEVVNCVQIRLYKPRDASNIGLSQIRLLGTSAFGGNARQQVMDLSEDESHCRYSLGWLRLLHHCCTLSAESELEHEIVSQAAEIQDLLSTCCGLLLVPTHIPALYLGNLEKVLCDLSLFNRDNGLQTIMTLLDSRPNTTEPSILLNMGSGKMLMNSPGAKSACELLYRICGHQDEDTVHRVALVFNWLETVACRAITTRNVSNCSPAYVSIIASIIWDAKQADVAYDLHGMITIDLFYRIYEFGTLSRQNPALKYAIDSLLCSICHVRTEFFPVMLQKIGVLVPNLSTDHDASISDDRKDSESMTDDGKENFTSNSEWYERLIIKNVNDLFLNKDSLETIALVSRSPSAIQQLLDSRLPKLLNSIILDYCTGLNQEAPMCTVDNVTAILKFFSDICEEKLMRDWLGSGDGSLFWLPLLQYLCQRTTEKRSNLSSEAHTYLEEVCVRFLSKCCLCHPNNQQLLAKVLCDVIIQQSNGISGFLRRLILQLLLENEKIPVSVKADETLYKNSTVLHPYLPLHPAFKQTHDRALLYLGTNTTIADILEQHVSFSSSIKSDNTTKKDSMYNMKTWCFMAADSDLSVAAGVTAKDKRAKDAKNLATSTPISKKKRYVLNDQPNGNDAIEGRVVKCSALCDQPLPLALSLAQVLRMIEMKGMHADLTCLHLTICQSKNEEDNNKMKVNMMYQMPLSSMLQVFSSMGGLALLAQHLPTVYPESIGTPPAEKTSGDQSESDWIKVEGSDDNYEDIDDGPGSSTPTKVSGIAQNVPPHSLTAFGLFLRLPGYAEVLLKDMKKALCLLRLVLGVTDDGEGADIFHSTVADSLPTLPFEVLRRLYDSSPLSTDDGTLLRRLSISTGVVHLLLTCLGIFTHQTQCNQQKDSKVKDDKGQLYWAKGTGFGTGSTQQSWNVEQALLKQRSEEEHVTVLLQVLSSYINPSGKDTEELTSRVLPTVFEELLAGSALLPALNSYLRNDSVLDMARHIPLYRAALELLRAMAVSCQLVKLLVPQEVSASQSRLSISSLLENMTTCVDTYASKLRSAQSNKTTNNKSGSSKYKFKVGAPLEDMERDEGLVKLMRDIKNTAELVCAATDKLMDTKFENSKITSIEKPLSISPEEQYLKIMKTLQFDTFEMILELPEGGYKFVISHHYEGNVRSAGESSHPARVKRLAQEAVTLATSLPLSHSSSVFVRCDTDRLDIMKVLITGPADTPYANGCFEFDVYFPSDYPLAPMMINLETTGLHSVRFNPNLYNDGKVCLSVLNTWHGRPEEKWNAQTSSFLQVLVSIQSLILVSEPYFNEPGYERSRGTPSGTQSSKEYNANICQATVRWAMLEQLLNPCPCFKDVIYAHFYIKRQEIMEQCERWLRDLENDNIEKRTNRTGNKRNIFTTLDVFKKSYETLKSMLLKLKPPEGVEDDGLVPTPSPVVTPQSPTSMDVDKTVNGVQSEQHDLVDIDMEKMVSDMCE
ncbi:PREDICTED: baculoviral IAP repeat-containing protein 6 isoform X2 [Nicrophorus vespilloides]|uniref:Baculoviral IAP repeat-containing protein 6 isoform X2 n=1 Tax=Nicrophorus vespilloides TaxID=110193 RepID=A0ABM1MPS2_NICVS|nr:PREDICTED: baculoviral IAP repeat-containing protein 6 isoform X2 [Nicrophorus vespilloides]